MNQEAIDVRPIRGAMTRVPDHAFAAAASYRRYTNGIGIH